MNRSPEAVMSEQQALEYSATNPPPNQADALAKVAALTRDCEEIELQLELADPRSYEIGEYQSWRKRAISALCYKKAELKFVQKWLNEKNMELYNPEDPNSPRLQGDHAVIMQRIRLFARELAAKIASRYTCLYTTESPPRDLESAHTRKAELHELNETLIQALALIAAEWSSYTLPHNQLTATNAPLNAVISRIQQEQRVLKTYLRTRSLFATMGNTLILALKRAMDEGFVLTQDEHATLDHFILIAKDEGAQG